MATRFLLYSHDTYGLGHLRRTTHVATGLVDADLTCEVLIVTGSPQAHAFPLPDRVDTVKLPCATKDAGGGYSPRTLSGGIGALRQLRSEIIAGTTLAFEPDVIVVDHAPIGMAGELIPLFERLSAIPAARRPRLVLGLRDIIDDAGRVQAEWTRGGVWEWLGLYDDVLVYGDENVLTTAAELGLGRRHPVTHTGYVASAVPEPVTADPFLLVTAGGGGDGHALLWRWLDAVEAGAAGGLRSVVVTGPLLSADRRARILTRAARLQSVEVVRFDRHVLTLMASAVGVVSMAGYNTVVEEMACSVPTLLVPRSAPRLEQTIRVERLVPLVGFQHCPVDGLGPDRVRQFVDGALTTERRPGPLALDGVTNVAEILTGRTAPGRRCVRAVMTGIPAGRHVGYILKQYPRLSETFILNEILGLERRGVQTTIFSLRHATEGRFHPSVAQVRGGVHYASELTRTTFLDTITALPGLATERLPEVLTFCDRLAPERRARTLINAIEVAARAIDDGVDHLHAHFLTVAAHTAHIVHILTGLPYTVTAHAKDIYRHTVDWTLAATIAAAAEAVVTVCDANLHYLSHRLDGTDVRLLRIYNGLDPQDPPPSDARTPGLVLGGRAVGREEGLRRAHRGRGPPRRSRGGNGASCGSGGGGDRRAAAPTPRRPDRRRRPADGVGEARRRAWGGRPGGRSPERSVRIRWRRGCCGPSCWSRRAGSAPTAIRTPSQPC